MDLPRLAEPWGRWIESEMSSVRDGLEGASSSSNSMGAQFRSRADNLSQTIAQFASRRTVILQAPEINGFASGSAGWVFYAQTASFSVSSRVRPQAMLTVAMTIPRIPALTISAGPNSLRVLVNGSQAGGAFNLNRVAGPEDLPVDSNRTPFRMGIPINPGEVNTITLELGSYISTAGSYNFQVQASAVELALTFEESR